MSYPSAFDAVGWPATLLENSIYLAEHHRDRISFNAEDLERHSQNLSNNTVLMRIIITK